MVAVAAAVVVVAVAVEVVEVVAVAVVVVVAVVADAVWRRLITFYSLLSKDVYFWKVQIQHLGLHWERAQCHDHGA